MLSSKKTEKKFRSLAYSDTCSRTGRNNSKTVTSRYRNEQMRIKVPAFSENEELTDPKAYRQDLFNNTHAFRRTL